MNDNGELAIRTQGLCKRYGPVNAVIDVDLRVRRGEIYGFLGRNGAGKTTTIRMLLGLVRPTSGTISVLGSSLREDRRGVLSRIGYFVESSAAYPNLTVRENLDIQRRLTGSPPSAVDRAIETLGLGEYRNRRAGQLSLGTRQRLSVARALLHSPELLILDEPANGLDPAGIVEIRTLLRRLADEEGVTIFMSSHLLDEVAHLADRVGIVHAGRLVEEVDYRLLRTEGTASIEVEVDDVLRAERILRDGIGPVELTRSGESGIRITGGCAAPSQIARLLVSAGIGLERLVPMEEALEEHFLRLTQESVGGAP
jgi:ABC-type multidrug transport system ATPase subunit